MISSLFLSDWVDDEARGGLVSYSGDGEADYADEAQSPNHESITTVECGVTRYEERDETENDPDPGSHTDFSLLIQSISELLVDRLTERAISTKIPNN